MKITRKILRQWGACYTNARIATLVPAKGLTPLEIAALDIPATDRLWVLLREEIIPARELRLLVCDWAEAACAAAGWNDQRSLEAIAVARRFACGEATGAELAAAWSAAAAARSARLSAARSTAARLAAAAAWSEAGAAAWSAVTAWSVRSAWSDRSAAARSAAAAEQLADVVRVLRKID
jgi:hypothetical protein